MKINFEVDFDFQFPETIGKEEALENSPILGVVVPVGFPEDYICFSLFYHRSKHNVEEIYLSKIAWNYEQDSRSRFPAMMSEQEIDVILKTINERARRFDFRDYEVEINN